MFRALAYLCLFFGCLLTFTDAFYNQNIACGWPDITRYECMRRTGCQWSPVYGTGYSGYSCFYPPLEVSVRARCGPESITLYECTHDRSCLYEESKTGNPSCFHKKPPAGSSATDQSIDCGFPEMQATECPIDSGCQWSPGNGLNWCYFPRDKLINQRTTPCGNQASRVECTKVNKCLFDTLATGSATTCFYNPGGKPKPDIPEGFEAVETSTQSVSETVNV
ncbi:hypothetical protein K493DRAFT_389747 [Basidiobolus meristosporus CBS 931.73]|uniref:P-type domain-containing protein n=1 Tax=Basidiobolus meristosporus CBS 931.73 TaxID=1314790 RepID=A0A1Y1X6G3_9FUNG|nr:hypothetical protein K493DRAFT_389747 [Basidiobolus meristosporus CBS 931.73]|eukprot:ORX80956.1 hypothetical protein K493DRAFT_389747 [Basidiobolus meristosporus CBS 931.73]